MGFVPHEVESGLPGTFELVRRAQDGQLDAFDRLFERYYPRVQQLVRLRLSPALRARMESGDLVHDALIAAIRGLSNFEVRDEGSLANWLARVVENTVRKAARHDRALKRDVAQERALDHVRAGIASGSVRFQAAAEGPSPSEVVAELETAERIEAALGRLSEEHREVILLRNWAGASWEGVAEALDRPSPDAARMLYGRALLELRKALEPPKALD